MIARMVLACTVALSMLPDTPAADKRPMTFEDLIKFKRVAEPQISPDGSQVVYQLTSIENDKSKTHLWMAATDGKTPPRQLTSSGTRDTHPRFSPDGKKILFESTRGGTSQLYILNLAAGGEAVQVTTIGTGAGNGIWSPSGEKVAFVSAVYPEFSEKPFAESDKLNAEKVETNAKNPVKAKVFSKLFYRHWDEYVGDLRRHLFVCNLDGSDCKDVTPGDRDADPTSSTFSVGDDFTFSPDGEHLVFTAVPAKGESWTTNYDLCQAEIAQPRVEWKTLTGGNLAADNAPRFSPDGKKLAYRAQKKAGYEADKWEIMVVDVSADGGFMGKPTMLEHGWQSVNEFAWLDNDRVVMTADAEGKHLLAEVRLAKSSDGLTLAGGVFGSLSVSRTTPVKLAYTVAQMNQPAEVMLDLFELRPKFGNMAVQNLSRANETSSAALSLGVPESVSVKIEDGLMQMWILKPPGFDAAKKWPVIYLVHGGPQGAWEDGWSYRWNPQLWAAQGYVVAMPNPRGSTGFGQKFVDEISGDWGGKCYRDLMAGVGHLEKLPYVDANRIGSAGGSFGGYMQNWFAVNTNKFKCLISHCSVYNFESMWGTTDELWFDEYEHGGLPWEIPGKYREFSPHIKAANLAKYKTPMLILHNDLDFRCPIGQGHELFSALQRQGIPSRFVNFPDEGHWVLKPANSRFWHKEVFAWLTKYVPPGGK